MLHPKLLLAAATVLSLAAQLGAQTSADVSITIVQPGSSPVAGRDASYEVHVKNFGPDTAVGTLTGSYPSVVTSGRYFSADGNCYVVPPNCEPTFNLAAGEEKLFSLFLELDPALDEGTVITTQIEAVTSTSDPNPSNNAASVTDTVTTKASLGLDPAPFNYVTPGQVFDWHSNIKNSYGPSVAKNVVLTIEPDPALSFESFSIDPSFDCTTPALGGSGAIRCTAAAVAANATLPIVLTLRAPQTTGSVPVVAKVSSSTPDSYTADNEVDTAVNIQPAVFFRVDISGPSSIAAGTTFTDTVTVTNDGPSDAPNVFVYFSADSRDHYVDSVTTTSNAGVQFSCTDNFTATRCSAPLMRNGESATLTFDIRVNPRAPNGMEIVADTSANAPGTVNTNPVWRFFYSSFVGAATHDLAIQKSGPALITAGETVQYDITVSNAGPDVADVDWTDLLPVNSLVSAEQIGGVPLTCTTHFTANDLILYWVECTAAALKPGESSTVRLQVRTSPRPGDVHATNVATVTWALGDADHTNDSSKVTSQVVGVADLSIAMTGPATANAGDHLTYSVSITQHGPSEAANLTFTDTLPEGATLASIKGVGGNIALDCSKATPGSIGTVTCTLSAMQPNDTSTLEVEVITSRGSSDAKNSVSVASAVNDPNPADNTATATTQMLGAASPADLAATVIGPSSVTPDQAAHYSVQVSNSGPADATQAVVDIVAPEGAAIVSYGAVGGAPFQCAIAAERVIRCTAASLPRGISAWLSAELMMGASSVGTTRALIATVSAAEPDSNLSNNTASATTYVGSAPLDVAVAMTANPKSIGLGNEVTYDVVVTASGTGSADGVTVEDIVPPGMKFASAVPSQGTCANEGTIVCRLGTLASGASATVRILLDTMTTGTIHNEVVVSSSTPEANGANNRSAADVTVIAVRRRATR